MGLSEKTWNETTINPAWYDSDGNSNGDGGTNDERWQGRRDDNKDNNNVDDDYDK